MKRILIFVVIGLLTVASSFANEAILIDFTQLGADITVGEGVHESQQNQRTMMNFADVAGPGFTPAQRASMLTSLAINNWDVTLSQSARTVTNNHFSLTREAPSRNYGTVMGVRVRFPTEPHNAWARITPPFAIPAFEFSTVGADGTITDTDLTDITLSGTGRTRSRFEAQSDGESAFGVVRNVGALRSVAVRVHGLNFPHTLTTILVDHHGVERNVMMGPLNFEGWAELQWNNPQYIQEVRNRDLRLIPLYPFNTPYVRFGGFLVQRDASHMGGDFITYFRDVRIIYDQAVLDMDRDIDDEAVWGIIHARETARKVWEMERFGHQQALRFLESERQAQIEEFDIRGRPVFQLNTNAQ